MLADTEWVWSQYDHMLFLNTVEGPGGDAAVLRLKHPDTGADTGRALALTTDGNHLWGAVDPRHGAAMTVAESVMNLAVVGARPLALVNCLNFGNPEHPEVMWQLSESVDGISEALNAFGVPCIGGNVSLYNESRGRDIDPTPIVGLLGVVDQLDRRPPGVGLVEGGRLVLVGETVPELAGSQWAADRGHRGRGTLPALDLDAVARAAGVVRELVAAGLVQGAHDVARGGVALALAEMAVRSGVGFTVARMPDHAALFSESAGRAVLCVEADQLRAALDVLEAHGVPHARIGVAGGDRMTVKDQFDLALADATATYTDRLPDALGAGTTQG
jgi:phosphoribosylformylglycinamidine synthase